jgi:hypothetical protein
VRTPTGAIALRAAFQAQRAEVIYRPGAHGSDSDSLSRS